MSSYKVPSLSNGKKTTSLKPKSKSKYQSSKAYNNTNKGNNHSRVATLTPTASKKTMNKVTFTNTNSPLRKNPNVITKFSEELRNIKACCDDLEHQLNDHCLLSKEKKEFENIKKENIKLQADVSILKEDMVDIMKKCQFLNAKITQLEKENEALKEQNKNLLKYISGNASNSQMNNNNTMNSVNYNNQITETECFNSNNDLLFSNSTSAQDKKFNAINHNIEDANNMLNQQISEMSAYNNMNNANININVNANANANSNNNNSNVNYLIKEKDSESEIIYNYSNYQNKQYNYYNTLGNDNNNLSNISNITNLAALTRMNQTLSSNSRTMTPIKGRRYLIPKNE